MFVGHVSDDIGYLVAVTMYRTNLWMGSQIHIFSFSYKLEQVETCKHCSV